MWDTLSDDQLCYPGYNMSCRRAAFSVGAQVGLYVLFGFNILVNIVGNSVVILSISHFKQLHSPTNTLIMSLSLADLLVGLVIVPFSMMRTVEGCWFYGEVFCDLHSSTDIFLTTTSVLHIICIAVDRYEAVCNPMRYTNSITMSVAWIMVAICWVGAAVFSYGLIYSKANLAGMDSLLSSLQCIGSCILIYNAISGTMYTTLLFFLPITIIVGFYSRIFMVAKEQAKKIEDSNQSAQTNGGLSKRSEHKAAKTLGIVLGVFVFCWMPYCLTSLMYPYVQFTSTTTIFDIFNWLAYFNSTMNPIIYALFYPWFRKCFKLIVKLKILNHNSSDMNVFIP